MAEIAIIGATLGVGALAVGKLISSMQDPIKTEGPRADGDRIGSSAYGLQIPLIFGTQNRIAGNLIWAGTLRERKRTETSGGKGGSPEIETTTYSYSRSYAFAIGESISNLTRIWANGKLLFSQNSVSVISATGETFTGGNGKPYTAIRVYPGSATQNPDPTIEATLGSGNACAYRYTAYVVIESLQLADFGNSTPNLEFEVSNAATTTGEIVATICERAGLTVDEYSVDASLSDTVDGMIISKQTDAIGATESLRTAFAFDVSEHAGTIRFRPRGRSIMATIETGDMAARRRGDAGADTPLETQRAPDYEMPKSATLTYIDYSRDYQENTQTSIRDEGTAETNLNVNIPITMAGSRARKVVDRLLWEPWVSRVSAPFRLSDKYQFLKPCDVVALDVAGALTPFRIERCTRGADGIIEAEAVMEDPFIYDGATTEPEAEIPANEEIIAGDTFAMAVNLPIIYPGEPASAFSWVIDAEENGWRGGQIMRSTDGGTTYSTMASSATRNTTGTVAAALAAAPTADAWDRANTITVVLLHADHELESLSELDVLNGRNAFWLGAADGSRGEVIQFATATLIDSNPKTYELTDLLRGRRATEHEMSLHGTNEVFVFFESGLMNYADFGVTDWDRERNYKGVSVLQAETDVVTDQAFTNLGEKAKPRSPVHGRGARDSSNNLTITWFRRTRHFSPGIGYGAVALDEPTESYQVDVYDGVTVVRTITATTPTASYTAAEQTTDGLTPGDPVDIRIYQISSTRGRGHAGVFTV